SDGIEPGGLGCLQDPAPVIDGLRIELVEERGVVERVEVNVGDHQELARAGLGGGRSGIDDEKRQEEQEPHRLRAQEENGRISWRGLATRVGSAGIGLASAPGGSSRRSEFVRGRSSWAAGRLPMRFPFSVGPISDLESVSINKTAARL